MENIFPLIPHPSTLNPQPSTLNRESLNPQPSTLNLQLTEHFKLSEFERSAKAAELGINNSVPPQYIPVLQQLCQQVLEPLRAFVGQPIVITSGYRCNQLNVKVGGAYASQHTLGEAADIRLPQTPYTAWDDNKRHTDLEEARRWFDWLEHNTDFDQLILETSNGKDFWIHVSCRKNRRANRHQVIQYMKKWTINHEPLTMNPLSVNG